MINVTEFVWANGMSVKDASRFWSKIDASGDCWLWTASTVRGYGQFRMGNRQLKAHRVAYEMLVGPIPMDLTCDHLCRIKQCVFPDHIELVSGAENTRRACERHVCQRGHLMTDGNRLPGGGCAICARASSTVRDRKRGKVDTSITCKNGHLRSEFGWFIDMNGHRRCPECLRLTKAAMAARRLH